LTRHSDRLDAWGDTLTYLAEILRLAGKHGEARVALEDALSAYERREHRVGAERARAALNELAPAA
jgi:hypothetical protein